jgi:hypothetical protein
VANRIVARRIEGDVTPIVEAHGDAMGCAIKDGPERAVLDADGRAGTERRHVSPQVVVAQEDDAIGGGDLQPADLLRLRDFDLRMVGG